MKYVNKNSLIFLLLFLSACSSSQDNRLATVNGKPVTDEAFNAYLVYKRIRPRDDEHRRKVLAQYLERVALAQVIEGKLDDAQRQANQAELDAFRRQMTISRYFDQYLKTAVDEQRIRNYYTAHEKDYTDTRIHVAHILIRLKKGMSESERRAKLTIANEAWSKLKAGEEMKRLADAYSEDRISAKKGGDLGWLKPGAIAPVFSQKMLSLKQGEISAPFETGFGYHIIKVLDEPKTVTKSYENVKGDIRYQLRQQSKQAELESLKKQVSIELANKSGQTK